MKQIFSFDNYRAVIKGAIADSGGAYGYRSALARAAGCQPAYFSQMLSGAVQLTPEHASGLSDFWNLNELESDYFLTLVDLGRAGTPSLKEKLLKRARDIAATAVQVQRNIVDPDQAEQEKQAAALIYYSNWKTSAVHVLLSVEELRNPTQLAKHLKISATELNAILADLAKIGLAKKNGMLWEQTLKSLHASSEKLVTPLHHRNWRGHAQEKLTDLTRTEDLHYTAVCAISNADFENIRAVLSKSIESTRSIMAPSKEEAGACLLLDWFRI